MPEAPLDARTRGLRRVHAVTATVAATALIGTGALVHQLGEPAAAATEPAVPGSGQQVAPQPGDDGLRQAPAPSDRGDDGDHDGRGQDDDGDGDGVRSGAILPPGQLPAPAPRGSAHASSGGS